MNTLSAFRATARLGLASLALAAALGQAQTTGRIKPVPQPAAPTPPAEAAVVLQPNVMGGSGQGGGAATPATAGMVAGPYTALQVAQSFLGADFNRDGELTRAEALRLTITPYSFEDMDQNKDGVLARSEYNAAFTR